MIQIQSSAPLIEKLLREQSFCATINYRLASYVIRMEISGSILLYNVLTKELLLIENTILEQEVLVKKWFLVPYDFDETNFISQVKNTYTCLNKRKTGVSNYTIFPTTDCNARCYYCFEKGQSRMHMNEHIAYQIIDFIDKHNHSEEINIQWFGGEPLYNIRVIDTISSGLIKRGIRFKSSMTTNGYLFNDIVIDKSLSIWNLYKAQITLDGTEKIYNKSKAYIHQDNNPYRRVLENIEKLLYRNIDVTIRLNISSNNISDLKNLVEQLSIQFSHQPHLYVYATPIYELISINEDSRRKVFNALIDLQNIIYQKGLGIKYEYFSKPRLNHCKSDNNCDSIIIFPDGNIGLCEHKFEGTYIGSVSDGIINYDEVESWGIYEKFSRCKKCFLFPDCLKISKCATNAKCYDELILFDKQRIEYTMHYMYKEFVKSKKTINI